LRRAGLDVLVREQAPDDARAGHGIQISPNASRVLIELGLDQSLRTIGSIPEALVARRWRDGKVIFSTPMGSHGTTRYGAPYYHMHRADLIEVLLHAVGSGAIRKGARCVGIEQRAEDVLVSFADGTTEVGDIVIGADGVHSVVRESVAGPALKRRARCFAWRGTVSTARLAGVKIAREAAVFWGPGRHFVYYLISGGHTVNFVAVTPQTDGSAAWIEEGKKEDLEAEFRGWCAPIGAILEGAGDISRWMLYDSPPLCSWYVGRVTLLGDAAHPMLPFQAQGAAQAIEDAWVLGRCLDRHGRSVAAALEEYERLRRPRATRVQRASRRNQWLFHVGSPLAMAARDALFGAAARLRPQTLMRALDWIYGYDVIKASG
jgi:salicylate hydroxylase